MRYIPSTATLLTAAIALLGAALPLARVVNHGVELSWDAINYAAVARNLLDGAGFVNYNGTPYTEWPPLYPLLLAAASGFGILDPRAVAGPLNALLFGLTIFLVGCYLRRRLNSPFLAVWATLAIALALPLAESVTWGLAGAPFILLTTLALLQTDRYLADRKTSSLLWAAVFCALAWQTRYLGAAVAVAIGLLLLFAPAATPPSQRFRNFALFMLIAALPVAVWLLRNYLTAGVLTGNQMPVEQTLPLLLRDTLTIISGWVTNFDLPGLRWPAPPLPSKPVSAAAAILVLLPVLAWLFRSALGQPRPRFPGQPVAVFGGFALSYFILMTTAVLLGNTWDGLQPRFLSPLYIPLLLVAVFPMDWLFHCLRESRAAKNGGPAPPSETLTHSVARIPNLLLAGLLLTLSFWTAAQLAAKYSYLTRPNIALNPETSATLRHLRDHPVKGIIYSNEPILVYLADAGSPAYRVLPSSRRRDYALDPDNPAASGRQQLADWLDTAPHAARVIWFHRWLGSHAYHYTAADLRALAGPAVSSAPGLPPGPSGPPDNGTAPRLALTADVSDGVIFQVNHPAAYTVQHNPERNLLTYTRQPCAQTDTAAPFFLHLRPVNLADLPADRRQYGFESHDFVFAGPRTTQSQLSNGQCRIAVPLPSYSLTHILTGQHTPDQGQLWFTELIIAP